jgi:fucose permease
MSICLRSSLKQKAAEQHCVIFVSIRPYLVLTVAIFLGGALELGLAQWLPAYAEMSLGFSKWTGSISLLAFSTAMALGRIFAGVIGRRVDPIKLMLNCCWASVVLFLLACFAPWREVALAASVAVGLAGTCLWPTTLGVAADRFPQGGASMFGLLAAFGNLGGILMPWLVGVTADRSSLRLGLATSTACPLLMAVVLLWMQRHPVSESKESDAAENKKQGFPTADRFRHIKYLISM